jgi:hypothetical protein
MGRHRVEVVVLEAAGVDHPKLGRGEGDDVIPLWRATLSQASLEVNAAAKGENPIGGAVVDGDPVRQMRQRGHPCHIRQVQRKAAIRDTYFAGCGNGTRVEWKNRIRQLVFPWIRTADSSQVTGVVVLPSNTEPRLM